MVLMQMKRIIRRRGIHLTDMRRVDHSPADNRSKPEH